MGVDPSSAELDFGRVRLRPGQRQLLVDAVPARLGARAYDLLLALVENRDRVVGKSELLDRVWPNLVVEENNLQVHISALRKLLGPQAVATIPGRGYRFTLAPVSGSGPDAGAPMPENAAAKPAASGAAALTNLPRGGPELFGRAADADELKRLILQHRLVSIIGAGGIGKTAIALEVAHHLLGEFADGVWLVELAALTSADLVPGSIAAAFNVRCPADSTAQAAMIDAFKGREVLLVLDNCEHLIDSVVQCAAALLAACPGVRVLATSQEILRLSGEQAYRLSPLAIPAVGDSGDATRCSAVELFVHRLKALDRSFEIDATNVAAVAEICRRLDGIALAIEMAAARVPLLGIEGVRSRLDERFRILSGGNRIALRRHQTLRAALEWSHGHLSEVERLVFRRVGIFAGGFALHALADVVADSGLDEWEAIERLGSLVDKSLVVAEGSPTPRYRLLETTRAFALEQLAISGETAELERRHARWIARLCEDLAEVMPTQRAIEWGTWFGSELDNVRAALDWAFAAGGDLALGVRLTGCAAQLFIRRYVWSEGIARQEIASTRLDSNTPKESEACLWDGVSMIWRNVNHHRDLAAAERSATLWKGLNPGRYLRAELTRARALTFLRREPEAQSVLHRVEGELDDWPALQGRYWNVRGLLAYFFQAEAAPFFNRARSLFDQVGDHYNSIVAHANLAESLFVVGHVAEAEAECRAAVAHARRWADAAPIGHTVGHLAGLLIFQRRLDEAEPLVHEALHLLPKMAYLFWFAPHLALRAALQGRWHTAARLGSFAQASYAALGHLPAPNEEQTLAHLNTLLAEHLDAQTLVRLRSEGASWTQAEVIAAAQAGQGA